VFVYNIGGEVAEKSGKNKKVVKYVSEDEELKYLAEILVETYLEHKKYDSKRKHKNNNN
jgi:hypothetical protein